MPLRVTSLASSGPRGEVSGSTALKTEPEQKLSPAEQLDRVHASLRQARDAKATAAVRRAEAKAKGYEGEMCGECLNFTLVRMDRVLKRDTVVTNGCS